MKWALNQNGILQRYAVPSGMHLVGQGLILNPTELLWDELDRSVKARQPSAKSVFSCCCQRVKGLEYILVYELIPRYLL